MVIGGLILLSMIGGIIHVAYEKHQRTAVKDIIKAAYEEDIAMREQEGDMVFTDNANRSIPNGKHV